MKEKYTDLVLLLVPFENTDVITASIGQGDNVLDDGFFD